MKKKGGKNKGSKHDGGVFQRDKYVERLLFAFKKKKLVIFFSFFFYDTKPLEVGGGLRKQNKNKNVRYPLASPSGDTPPPNLYGDVSG